ncbi:hypothetical protein [Polyangium aurulentum]|uniref:hypothetical protein n=1 Tax=Polyangium aurulentum TaxID=2567896 RepID=UPI0010ADDA82|nr:hypothetical protein [Polyangium aurulentum]UQA54631.1 hypothetical protein E8A73_024985 [Polyangium aurulentum]
MQMTRPGVVALLLATTACASTSRDTRAPAKRALREGIAEFYVTSYDGRLLEGRVLVGATVDTFVIDGRLPEWFAVALEEVRECGKPELLDFWSIETFLPPPRADELVTLRPGYWYGGNVSFPLLDRKKVNGVGVACVEANLVVRARGMGVAARLPIRVVRTDVSASTKDADTR